MTHGKTGFWVDVLRTYGRAFLQHVQAKLVPGAKRLATKLVPVRLSLDSSANLRPPHAFLLGALKAENLVVLASGCWAAIRVCLILCSLGIPAVDPTKPFLATPKFATPP